jgi:hypothetical protein
MKTKLNDAAAEMMIVELRARGVAPDAELTAVAGVEYGRVEVWTLTDGSVVIFNGDNGSSDYAHVDDLDEDNLEDWLVGDDLDDLGRRIALANVIGPEAVAADEADETDEGPYAVLITHNYYGPTRRSDAARMDDGRANVLEFDARSEAQAWIDEVDGGIYVTGNNESGRPDYTIVKS